MKPTRHRRSIRLPDYDYRQTGAYFITICTHERTCLFGEISNGIMVLNEIGHCAADCWQQIPVHFPNVELDQWVIMPNHIHGILKITTLTVGANDYSPLHHAPTPSIHQQGTSRTIGSMVRGFKIGVTKWHRQNAAIHQTPPFQPVWQRNYWERIIRNEAELNHIRQYIADNPAKWQEDSLYTSNGRKEQA